MFAGMDECARKAVSALLKSKQILAFGFAQHNGWMGGRVYVCIDGWVFGWIRGWNLRYNMFYESSYIVAIYIHS